MTFRFAIATQPDQPIWYVLFPTSLGTFWEVEFSNN